MKVPTSSILLCEPFTKTKFATAVSRRCRLSPEQTYTGEPTGSPRGSPIISTVPYHNTNLADFGHSSRLAAKRFLIALFLLPKHASAMHAAHNISLRRCFRFPSRLYEIYERTATSSSSSSLPIRHFFHIPI